ncbi:MAG: hypothetical protein ACLUKN_05060 [Bacilli bacterium]
MVEEFSAFRLKGVKLRPIYSTLEPLWAGSRYLKRLSVKFSKRRLEVSESAKIDGFKLWSPDSPNLYYVVFKLSD